MLAPTLNYFHISCHVNEHTCHTMGLAFICLCWRRSLPSLPAVPAQCVCVPPHSWSLTLLAGQKFPAVEQQVLIILCKVGTAWRMLKNFPLKLFMHPHPSLNSQHHFLTFSSSAPSPYPSTICVWISTRQTIQCLWIIILTLQDFQFSCLSFDDSSERGKIMTLYFWHTKDNWPLQEVNTSPVRLLFTVVLSDVLHTNVWRNLLPPW